ncbi:MAG TPA: hypothetical protein VGX76_03625, partial [Pirellulales bacterium]|nr:hypothetical protein [Pirellulales bacterium]
PSMPFICMNAAMGGFLRGWVEVGDLNLVQGRSRVEDADPWFDYRRSGRIVACFSVSYWAGCM